MRRCRPLQVGYFRSSACILCTISVCCSGMQHSAPKCTHTDKFHRRFDNRPKKGTDIFERYAHAVHLLTRRSTGGIELQRISCGVLLCLLVWKKGRKGALSPPAPIGPYPGPIAGTHLKSDQVEADTETSTVTVSFSLVGTLIVRVVSPSCSPSITPASETDAVAGVSTTYFRLERLGCT